MARNGRSGWELIQTFKPDLVILDLMMPGLDGMGLLKLIGSSFKIRVPKVLILSAVQEMKSVEEAMSLGASGYLLKPIENKRLLSKIQSLIG